MTEVLKHASVEEVIWCEIDKGVMDMGKKYYPKFAPAFSDDRVHVHLGDGAAFLKEHKASFDVIITDSSDPIGPAETLFASDFFTTLHAALREGGITASQGECLWLHLDIIKKMMSDTRKIFSTVNYGYLTIPTYPSGQIGVLVCSNIDRDVTKPLRTGAELMSADAWDNLQYYDESIHASAFVLPRFAKSVLQ